MLESRWAPASATRRLGGAVRICTTLGGRRPPSEGRAACLYPGGSPTAVEQPGLTGRQAADVRREERQLAECAQRARPLAVHRVVVRSSLCEVSASPRHPPTIGTGDADRGASRRLVAYPSSCEQSSGRARRSVPVSCRRRRPCESSRISRRRLRSWRAAATTGWTTNAAEVGLVSSSDSDEPRAIEVAGRAEDGLWAWPSCRLAGRTPRRRFEAVRGSSRVRARAPSRTSMLGCTPPAPDPES
jgi:hypothetical protein